MYGFNYTNFVGNFRRNLFDSLKLNKQTVGRGSPRIGILLRTVQAAGISPIEAKLTSSNNREAQCGVSDINILPCLDRGNCLFYGMDGEMR